MILTIGLTQCVFVSLGILTLNVLLKAGGYAANVASSFPPLGVHSADGVDHFCRFVWLFSPRPVVRICRARVGSGNHRGNIPRLLLRLRSVDLGKCRGFLPME